MRILSAFIIWMATIVVASSASLKNLERFSISGTEYVRLLDWSESANLRLRWTRKDEDLEATNRLCKFQFSVNSSKAYLNGIDTRLSFPIIVRNGVPLIGLIDVLTTFNPLLYPEKNSPGEKIQTICLDAGHGGRDTGKIAKGYSEKTYTLLLCEELGRALKQKGFKVIYTRVRDQVVDLDDRINFANRRNADLFLSLHYNSATPDIHGVETYCMTPAGAESSNAGGGDSAKGNSTGNTQNSKNMLLAYTMHRSILVNTGLADRGVKRARFLVLKNAKMPAVLVEGGFMTNPIEAKKIYDPQFRKRMASAIVEGVLAYQKIVEVAPPAPPATNQTNQANQARK